MTDFDGQALWLSSPSAAQIEARRKAFHAQDHAALAAEIEEQVAQICRAASGYSTVINERFKGGWTTRHYGQPLQGVHAIQMELAQFTYLKSETAPFEYDPEKADCLRITLRAILGALTEQAPTLKISS